MSNYKMGTPRLPGHLLLLRPSVCLLVGRVTLGFEEVGHSEMPRGVVEGGGLGSLVSCGDR